MSAKKDLEKQVVIAAGQHNMSSVLLRNTISRKLGLNIADMECVNLLMAKGVSTPTELGRYTGLTTGSTTVMLDRLEKAKLITRRPNPEDRRGVLIEVTDESRAKLRPAFAGIRELQNELISSYSDTELVTIADFLTRFADNIKTYTKSVEKDAR